MLLVTVLCVIYGIMMYAIMLSAIILCVIMLGVVKLSVSAVLKQVFPPLWLLIKVTKSIILENYEEFIQVA